MTVELKDVPAWGYLRAGIAHALFDAEKGGWCFTLCGTMSSSYTPHKAKAIPSRICRKCRKLLKEPSIRKVQK